VFIALGGSSYAALEMPKNSVGSKHIKMSAVGPKHIKRNAVTSAKVKRERGPRQHGRWHRG
jgi:hypothetical protein